MIQIIVGSLIVVGCILSAIYKKTHIYIYLFFYFIAPYLISFFATINSLVDYQIVTNGCYIYLFFVFLISFIRNKFKIYNVKATVLLIIFALYLLFEAFIHNAPLNQYFMHFFIPFMLPLYFVAYELESQQIDYNKLTHWFLVLFIWELGLSLIQYFGGLLLPNYTYLVNDRIYNRSFGTFGNANLLGMFSLLFLFLFLKNNTLTKNGKIVLSFVTFLVLLFSGVRTYLLCFFIFVPIIYAIQRHKKKLSLFLIIPVFITIFYFISTLNRAGYLTSLSSSSIERQVYGLSNFVNGRSVDEQSTIYLSIYVFDNYLVKNPLFGSGLLYQNTSYDIVSPELNNVMDAGLCVYTSEFGIIGMLLFLLYQLAVILKKNMEKGNRQYTLLLYAYALFITITDAGVFYSHFMICLLLMSYCNANNLSQPQKIFTYEKRKTEIAIFQHN